PSHRNTPPQPPQTRHSTQIDKTKPLATLAVTLTQNYGARASSSFQASQISPGANQTHQPPIPAVKIHDSVSPRKKQSQLRLQTHPPHPSTPVVAGASRH